MPRTDLVLTSRAGTTDCYVSGPDDDNEVALELRDYEHNQSDEIVCVYADPVSLLALIGVLIDAYQEQVARIERDRKAAQS